MDRIKLTAAALLLSVWGAAAVPAQEEPVSVDRGSVKRLGDLLDQLRRVDRRVWQARVKELEDEIAGHKETAVKLRAEAEKLRRRAAEADRRAAGVEKEIHFQRDMMRLVELLPKREATAKTMPPSMKKASPAPAMQAPEPKAGTAAEARKLLNFADHVVPIFEASCTVCHEPDDPGGGLDVSSYGAAMRGGSSGEVIAPGDAEGSRLFRLVNHTESPFMPQGQGKLPEKEIAVLRAWIDQGAHPDADAARKAAAEAAKKDAETAGVVSEAPGGFGPDAPMPDSVPFLEADAGERPPVVKTLAASPAAPLVATPGLGQVILRHAETWAPLAVLPFAAGDVEVLAFSRDGERLLAAGGSPGGSGAAVLYEVRTGRVVAEVERRRGAVLAAAVSPLQTLIAVGGAGGDVAVHRTETGELLYTLEEHDDWVLSLDFSPDGNYLASADRAGKLLVTEADTGRNLHALAGHEGPVHRARFRPDAEVLASGGGDGTLRLWDVEKGSQIRSRRAHDGQALDLAWAADHRLASAGSDGRVKLFKPDGAPLRTVAEVGDWAYAVAFDALASRLYVGAWDGRVRVFDAATGREITPVAP